MNATFIAGLVGGIVAAFMVAFLLLEHVIGPRARAREQARLDRLIRPLGADQYRFTGHDDKLRLRAEQRRHDADVKRREAAQIASGKPARLLHRVVNE